MIKFARVKEPQVFLWSTMNDMFYTLRKGVEEYGEIEWMQLLEQGR